MHQATDQPSRLIRLAILDDNPFIRLPSGEVRPRAATFHRFAEAVIAAGPFAPARYLIPVRDVAAQGAQPLGPVNETRLRVVATAPFDGVAGYLRSWPALVRRNWPVLRAAVAAADLVWIKAPASNGALAAVAARSLRVPYFTWVAGSTAAVVRGQHRRGLAGALARRIGAGYDAVTEILARSGPAVRLDDELFTSLVTDGDVAVTRRLRGDPSTRAASGHLRIAWAGRIVADKGIDDLLTAVRSVRDRGVAASLTLIGDGPARATLQARARELGLADTIKWPGHVADRAAYFDALRAADLFVLPSRAEGVPKVVVEAMAAGLPVIATTVGALPRLLDDGRLGRLVAPNDPGALATAIVTLGADGTESARLTDLGLEFAERHTIDHQARRLVTWLMAAFPRLPWPEPA